MSEKQFEIFPQNIVKDGTLIILQKGLTLYNVNEVRELLNALHEENEELRLQLNLCSDQRNEFHRGARENAHRVGKLEKENEQLKSDKQALIDFIKMKFPKSYKHILEGFE